MPGFPHFAALANASKRPHLSLALTLAPALISISTASRLIPFSHLSRKQVLLLASSNSKSQPALDRRYFMTCKWGFDPPAHAYIKGGPLFWRAFGIQEIRIGGKHFLDSTKSSFRSSQMNKGSHGIGAALVDWIDWWLIDWLIDVMNDIKRWIDVCEQKEKREWDKMDWSDGRTGVKGNTARPT